MLDRCRQLLRPLVVGLAVVGLLLIASLQHERQGDGDTITSSGAESAQPAVDFFSRGGVSLESEACADAAKAGAEDSERSEKRDLCAQYRAAVAAEKAAGWTEIQTWIGVFGLVGVLYGLLLNYRATKAATDSNKQARKLFQDERRPWLRIKAFSVTGSLESDHARMQVIMRVKNVGMTPALNADLCISPKAFERFEKPELDQVAAEIEAAKIAHSTNVGGIIFPGSVAKKGAGVEVQLLIPRDFTGTAYVPLWVVYRYAGSDVPHVTPYVLELTFYMWRPLNVFTEIKQQRIDNKEFPISLAPD